VQSRAVIHSHSRRLWILWKAEGEAHMSFHHTNWGTNGEAEGGCRMSRSIIHGSTMPITMTRSISSFEGNPLAVGTSRVDLKG
jgi:hypothetical protein